MTMTKADRYTFALAIIAIVMSGFSTYLQFFNKRTDLGVQVLNQRMVNQGDSLFVQVDLLFLNTGDRPVCMTQGLLYIGADRSTPIGYYSGSWKLIPDNMKKWYVNRSDDHEGFILDGQELKSTTFSIGMAKTDLMKFVELNPEVLEGISAVLQLGIDMKFVNSMGRKREIKDSFFEVKIGYTLPEGGEMQVLGSSVSVLDRDYMEVY